MRKSHNSHQFFIGPRIFPLLAVAFLAFLLAPFQAASGANRYKYVGSWELGIGPAYGTNPPVYTGQQTAALLFGGLPSQYAISTISNNAAQINFMTWLDGWGVHNGTLAADNYSKVTGTGYNNPGGTGTAFSAYVQDAFDGTDPAFTNYAFLILPSLFSPYALTPNQHAVASALDYAVTTNNPGIQNLVNYLYNLPTNYLPASFDMISGEEYTSVFDTAYAIAHLQNQAITNHLASIQAGEPGLSLGLVSLAMASGGKSTTDGKDSKIVNQPVVDNRWGFFATANGDFTDITGDTNANGFQYATEGLTLGVDYRVLPQLVLGAYLAYEHSYTTLINNGALDANGITGGLYGSWFSQGFYVNGIVGGGYSGFTARRQSVGGFTRGDGDNTLLNAAINGGYDMHYGAWTFGPQLGIEYDDVWLNSFTENGSLAPLSVASQSENSLRSTAGWHISYTTHVGGVTVRPDVHAAWQHEYDSPANSLGAQIAGTNAAFVVQGPYLGRNSALAGAGVTVELSEKTSVYADYEGQFGRTHETQSTVSVGFQTKF